MSEPTYVEQLRAIRDRIGQQVEKAGWQAWEAQARQAARRDPALARLIEQAEHRLSSTAQTAATDGKRDGKRDITD